ncbi:hypothetical protein Q5P01_005689 [Channa striata]|uniref:Keratin, type II cytoskeletal 8 n=1 Tax=Channa striata TaxID=64152 RepID=A0AA88NE15_CHASR|nr:hypothetical protein Q5P01_005689 [Channa striata]
MSEKSSTAAAKDAPMVDKSRKHKEKNDMVGLNDKFVQLIDKVKHLEGENRKLETKLKILKEQGATRGRSTTS